MPTITTGLDGLLSDDFQSYSDARSIPTAVRVVNKAADANNKLDWDDLIERLLLWRSRLDQFEEDDRPDIGSVDGAISVVCGFRDRNEPVPTSVIPSGSGRISMEWHAGDEILIIDIAGEEVGTATYMDMGVVTEKLPFERVRGGGWYLIEE